MSDSNQIPFTDEARGVLTLVRELKSVSENDIKILEQLFTYRIHDELVSTLVQGKEETLVKILFKVTQTTHNSNLLGYVLRFFSDLAQVCPNMQLALADPKLAESGGTEDPCSRFMDYTTVYAQESGIVRPAVFLCASILRHSQPDQRLAQINQFLNYCNKQLAVVDFSTSRDIEYIIHAVTVFVKRKELRSRFQEAHLVQHLPRLLTYVCTNEAAQMVQLTYEALLACWILSFDYPCIVDLYKAKIIPTVHKTLQRATKEKCVRMGIMILKNLAKAEKKVANAAKQMTFAEPNIDVLLALNNGKGPAFFSDMIGIGFLKTLWQLQRKKYGDEDISPDIEELTNLLETNIDELTSFSEYRGEVHSGVMEWSPVHTSVKFWKENYAQFEANQYEMLRELVALLDSPSEITMAVAAHDVGELVRHHPSGRLLLQLPSVSGAKTKILGLMSHANPDVARNALLAVQKIMVQRWEFLNK